MFGGVFLIFNFWIESVSLYILSLLCFLIFLLCFLVRKASFNHYTMWVQHLDINNYILAKDAFTKNIIISGISVILNKIKTGSV